MSHLVTPEYSVTINCGATVCTFLVNARDPVAAVRQAFAGFVDRHREDLTEITFCVERKKPKGNR